ncbi:polysaccharide pyruvyl transferase family protein [Arenibacterium sp. CAU 1754]
MIFHSTRNDNLGVGALTVSDIRIMRDLAQARGIDLKMVVVDSHDPRAVYVQGDDVDIREVRELRNVPTIFNIFRNADIVVDIGGGDSFSDIYGGKRLFRLLLLKYLALLAGKPLVLAPQTMGPFARNFWARLSRPAINRAAIVATRDKLSTQYLRDLGVRRDIVEASDVALKLPYDAPTRTPGGKVKVGINVSGLLMSGGYTGSNQFGLAMDYPGLMRTLISGFQEHSDGCEVHLVPHVISHIRGAVEDDYQASVDLAAEFEGVTVAPDFASPSEAKTYIAGMDFFMGARMHACIAAFSSGVPVVPMAYSRKFAGLFGSLGYDQTVDCTTETGEAIAAKIFAAYDNRETLLQDMLRARDQGLVKLGAYEDALGALMEKVGR